MNNEFCTKNFCWDAAFTKYAGDWYAMCLFAPRTSTWGDEQFWKLPHSAAIFRKGKRGWEFNRTIESPSGHRLCAGSLYSAHGTLYASLAHNFVDCGNFRIGQELLFYNVTSRMQFLNIYSPGAPFSTARKDDEGRPIYGCRDPFTVAWVDAFYHYVCSGGSRWGVPPEIILLKSASPYDTFTSETVAVRDPHWNGVKAFHEIERCSVFWAEDRVIMTAHCWHGWVTQEMRDLCFGMGEKVTDSTIWVFESDSFNGPFKLREDIPFIPGSSELGMYGTHIRGISGDKIVGMGWDMDGIYCDRRQAFRVDPLTLDIEMDRWTFV